MPNIQSLDTFTRAYIEAALWSSTLDDGTPMDRNHGPRDIAPATLKRMELDCETFQQANADHITDANLVYQSPYRADKRAGHDFWLTRNHHGAGFWDGDWQEPAATLLTNAAHAYGETGLYVGDDGQIHGE